MDNAERQNCSQSTYAYMLIYSVHMTDRLNLLLYLDYLKEKVKGVVRMVMLVLQTDWELMWRFVRSVYCGLFVACASYGAPMDAPVWYKVGRVSGSLC